MASVDKLEFIGKKQGLNQFRPRRDRIAFKLIGTILKVGLHGRPFLGFRQALQAMDKKRTDPIG